MPIQVPEYRNRVTKGVVRVGEEKAALPHAQNFENGARSMMQLGHAVSQEGDRWARALAHREERESAKHAADILLAFDKENSELLNGTVDEKGNTITPGLLASQLENAKGTAQTYLTKGNELMGKYLGMAKTKSEQAYLERALGRSYQNSYDRMISHELDQTRSAAAKSTKAYFDTAKGMAGAITKPQDMREHLDDLYQMSDKEGRSNGLDEEALKSARYGVANENVSASVEGAVLNGNLAAARKVLDGAKNDLLPADYNKLNAFIIKAQKTKEKADDSENVSTLYNRALTMAEKDPDELQNEIVKLLQNPASAQADYSKQIGPVSAKHLIEYAKWVQTNLLDSTDTRAGRNKALAWQEHEAQFTAFKLDTKKNKIGNKEMNNPQTVLHAIGSLQGAINNHAFDSKGITQAQKDLSHLRAALGNMDIKANNTVLGEVVKQTNLLAGAREQWTPKQPYHAVVGVPGVMQPAQYNNTEYETERVGGILTPEEKGVIVETAVNALQTQNVNLLAVDGRTKSQAASVVQQVARDYVRNKFAINQEDVTDVQVGNNTFKSYGIKPNPNLGASIASNLDGYRYEEQNGVAYLIKRDKNGNELHRQLL